MVEAAETILVERVSHRLVVTLTVVLQVVQEVSVMAVLENQVNGSWEWGEGGGGRQTMFALAVR